MQNFHKYFLMAGLITGLGLATWISVPVSESSLELVNKGDSGHGVTGKTGVPVQIASGTIERQSGSESTVPKDAVVLPDQPVYQDFAVLQGTNPPGNLQTDEEGRLIVSHHLKLNFDYFLQILGTPESDHNKVYLATLNYLASQLPTQAYEEARQLFSQYYEYYLELNGMVNQAELLTARNHFDGEYNEAALSLVDEYYGEKSGLKDLVFSETEREAMFAEEERYEKIALLDLKEAGLNLSDPERLHFRQQRELLLSDAEKQTRSESSMLMTYKKVLKHIETSGGSGSSDALRHHLTQQLGQDKAEKLVEINNERADWRSLKSEYEQRKAIILQSGITVADVSKQLDSLMREDLGFTELQVRRVQASEGRLPVN